MGERYAPPAGANLRDVWQFHVGQFSGAHFAVFPEELPERCIKLGTSEKGECSECGKPWVRMVESKSNYNGRVDSHVPNGDPSKVGSTGWRPPSRVENGWQPSCSCATEQPPTPQTVLDPFAGSGTTLLVASRLGRESVGIEINPEYVKIAESRIAQAVGLTLEQVTELEPEKPTQLTFI